MRFAVTATGLNSASVPLWLRDGAIDDLAKLALGRLAVGAAAVAAGGFWATSACAPDVAASTPANKADANNRRMISSSSTQYRGSGQARDLTTVRRRLGRVQWS